MWQGTMREYDALMARFERTDHLLTGASESAQPKHRLEPPLSRSAAT